MHRPASLALIALPLALLAACDPSRPTAVAPVTDGAAFDHAAALATPTVVASGLSNPRGLAFGPDHAMYVAVAGTGGTLSTAGLCQQVPSPPGPGPFTGGYTGSIVRVDAGGRQTTFAEGLPSALGGGGVTGVADLAFVGDHLFALINAGCANGNLHYASGVYAVGAGGRWQQMIANLGHFTDANPVANPDEDDFAPGGNWYSMIAAGGSLYALDANGGQLVRVGLPSGAVSRVIDMSATEGHIVPTALAAAGHGGLLVGNLGTFPAVTGDAKIFHVSPSGAKTLATTGFTTILGLAMAGSDMYVLETLTCPAAPLPCVPAPFAAGTGRVVRLDAHGTRTVVAAGLNWPTSLRLGPDGALYVTNKGYNLPPGSGEVLRVDVSR